MSFSSISIVEFEQVIDSWEISLIIFFLKYITTFLNSETLRYMIFADILFNYSKLSHFLIFDFINVTLTLAQQLVK